MNRFTGRACNPRGRSVLSSALLAGSTRDAHPAPASVQGQATQVAHPASCPRLLPAQRQDRHSGPYVKPAQGGCLEPVGPPRPGRTPRQGECSQTCKQCRMPADGCPLPQRDSGSPRSRQDPSSSSDAAARSTVHGSGNDGVTGSPPARPGRHADRLGGPEAPRSTPAAALPAAARDAAEQSLPGAPERPSGSATGVGGAAHAERGGPAAAAGFGALPDIGSSSWVQPQQSPGLPSTLP